MTESVLTIRKLYSHVEETRTAAGRSDDGGPIRKIAVCAVVANPYANCGYVEDLSRLIDASADIGRLLGAEAARLLGAPVEGYGKGGLVGTGGEQEHINAALTSVFGNAFREAIGGGEAWIPSVTKPGAPGACIDVPTAYRDEVWVRSHYDAVEVRVPDAPHDDELVVIVAVTNRGRLNARVGGKTVADVLAS